MEPQIKETLDKALQEKKINKNAYDEIVKWLTEEEFEEYKSDLVEKIKAFEWVF